MACLTENISKGMSIFLVKYKKMLFYNRTNALYVKCIYVHYMSFQITLKYFYNQKNVVLQENYCSKWCQWLNRIFFFLQFFTKIELIITIAKEKVLFGVTSFSSYT